MLEATFGFVGFSTCLSSCLPRAAVAVLYPFGSCSHTTPLRWISSKILSLDLLIYLVESCDCNII